MNALQLMKRHPGVLVAGVALLAVGVAQAAPGLRESSDIIYACAGDTGTLRIVERPRECRRDESALSWNREGPTGPRGPSGPAGAAGAAGPVGATGAAGAVGATGSEGPRGPAGNDGAAGPAGPQGPAGAPGASGGGGFSVADLRASLYTVARTLTTTAFSRGPISVACDAPDDVMLNCSCEPLRNNVLTSVTITSRGTGATAPDSCVCVAQASNAYSGAREDFARVVAHCVGAAPTCAGTSAPNTGEACSATCSAGVVDCSGVCVAQTPPPPHFGEACTVRCACGEVDTASWNPVDLAGTVGCDGSTCDVGLLFRGCRSFCP